MYRSDTLTLAHAHLEQLTRLERAHPANGLREVLTELIALTPLLRRLVAQEATGQRLAGRLFSTLRIYEEDASYFAHVCATAPSPKGYDWYVASRVIDDASELLSLAARSQPVTT